MFIKAKGWCVKSTLNPNLKENYQIKACLAMVIGHFLNPATIYKSKKCKLLDSCVRHAKSSALDH